MSAIKISNLVKKFNGFTAVNDLSFEVRNNKIFGFLGPNGAGKTTTIRMMIGLSKITSGRIEIDGKKVEYGNIATNKLIGYLPEQPAFYGWMNGEEYLNFVADLFQISNKEKIISKLLSLVSLTDARKKNIGTYSNGMKQRLGIAQALINDPPVLIMDEPVSALDPIGRKEVLEVIAELKKSKTVFMSTHILSDVDRICDDVAIINKGKLITTAPLASLKEKYAKPILEVEFKTDPQEIVQLVKKEAWADKLEKNGNYLKVWLKESEAIDKNLPLKFFAKENLPVLKYGLNLPEIEDLFVEMVKEDK